MATPMPALASSDVPVRLTKAQRRLLDALTAAPTDSVAQICESASVSLRSYYAWCQDPQFRQLTTQIWSQAFLANGWQLLNRIAQNVDKSAGHARILCQLLFDPKGQAALAAWANPIQPAAIQPATDAPSTPAPARIVRFLAHTTAVIPEPEPAAPESEIPSAPVQAISEHAQPLAAENCTNPASANTARGTAPVNDTDAEGDDDRYFYPIER